MRAYVIVLIAAMGFAALHSVPAQAAAAAKAIDIMPIASTKADAKAPSKAAASDPAKPAKKKRKRAPKKTPPADDAAK